MANGARTFQVRVLAGGDPLREERLTRSLRDELAELEGVSVGFSSGAASSRGSKAGPLTDLVLAVAVLASSKPLAGVLTTAITEWCARERHRKVRVTRGDAELEITGSPDADQRQLVREFLEEPEPDA
ncbi:hypothetical protein AB8O55_11530 [Saccharopolyspora cebuensis]|uniref:Uncharacterized protein n=1 Tax=Saccharopolyspora cebuensis TaxID=418759 RepID=A0ABV4CJ52_9PSEU